MINDNLSRYKNLKILTADVETEGLNFFFSRPWNLAFTVTDGKQLVDEKDYYPWFPDLKISPDAARITRFDFETYKAKSIDPLVAYNHFASYYYNPEYIILGQNFFYDHHIIMGLERILGINVSQNQRNEVARRIVDTSAFYKAIKLGMEPPGPTGSDEFAAWQISLVNYVKKGLKSNLALICKENDIDIDLSLCHQGLYDVKKTLEAFNKLIWQIKI